MEVAILIYVIVYVVSIYWIVKKGKESLYLLPLIFIFYEIIKNIFIEHGVEVGINGAQNLNIFLFLLPHLNRLLLRFRVSLLIILTFIAYFIFKMQFVGGDIFSLVSQGLGFINLYILLIIGLTMNLEKYNNILPKLNNSLLHVLIIYCVYIIIASLLKFGPNHYNTDIIYGLRFEQYYSAALIIVLLPVIIKYYGKSKTTAYYIFSIIAIVLMILTLRRTSYVILLVGFFLYPVLLFNYKLQFEWLKQNIVIISATILFIIFASLYTNILDFREFEFSQSYSLEEEGRFIEFILVKETLTHQNNLIFGAGSFLNDAGKYNFHNPERPLHSTISKLLFAGGIFGLAIFFIVFLYLTYLLISTINKHDNVNIRKYRSISLLLIIIYLTVSLTGGIGVGTGISFTGTLFLYLGLSINTVLSERDSKRLLNTPW